MKYLYIMISNDQYELPEIVTDNLDDMTARSGRSKGTIKSMISRYEHGVKKYSRFRRVKIDE